MRALISLFAILIIGLSMACVARGTQHLMGWDQPTPIVRIVHTTAGCRL